MKGNPEALFSSVEEITEALETNPRAIYFDYNPCNRFLGVRVVPVPVLEAFPVHVSFVVQKGSEFQEVFNHYLVKAKESGLYSEESEDDYMKSFETVEDAEELDMENVIFPFLVMAIGLPSALIVLFLEIMKAFGKKLRNMLPV